MECHNSSGAQRRFHPGTNDRGGNAHYLVAAIADGIAVGAGTEVAGLRPGFPFGISTLLRLIRKEWIGFASFGKPINF